MRKDLGVSFFREAEEEKHLVYFRPYDKKERHVLLTWAKKGAAEDYYQYFDNIAQRFKNSSHLLRLEDVIEKTINYGFRHGKGYKPKATVETFVKSYIKSIKKKLHHNPLYGNAFKDVLGRVKITLQETSIRNIIMDLSKAFEFDPSFPLKQIELRPYYPHPDDYAKYTYYFYFISMCMVYSGFTMQTTYLRDWEYLYYLPFCHIISADKRFFKNIRQAMKDMKTDRTVGINISDRILIWGEDSI